MDEKLHFCFAVDEKTASTIKDSEFKLKWDMLCWPMIARTNQKSFLVSMMQSENFEIEKYAICTAYTDYDTVIEMMSENFTGGASVKEIKCIVTLIELHTTPVGFANLQNQEKKAQKIQELEKELEALKAS